MKNVIILPKFHSLIDVITNSSSELFITSSGKSIEAVKEFLNNLEVVLAEDIGIGEVEELTEDTIEEFFDKIWLWHSYIHSYVPKHLVPLNYYDFFQLKNFEDTEETKNLYNEYLEDWKKSYWEEFKNLFVGRILIYSRTDNSVPYHVYEVIQHKFDTITIHLG